MRAAGRGSICDVGVQPACTDPSYGHACVCGLQAFGIDDGRIPVIMAVLGVAFASLFSTWSNAQNNEEFFSVSTIHPRA